MVDKIKVSSVYSIFGKHYGNKLIELLNECCDSDNSFCNLVKKCLGISESGNTDKVLNQKGEWITLPSGTVYTFSDTPSIDLSLSGIDVTADVKLDPNPSNIISITPSGLLATIPTVLTEQTFEELDIVSGNTVVLPITPISVKVYRNGIRLSSTEYSLSGTTITFVDSFGASGGAIGPEDVIIDYFI